MGRETGVPLILERHRLLEGLVVGLGMDISAIAAPEDMAGDLARAVDAPVIPLHLYMRSLY